MSLTPVSQTASSCSTAATSIADVEVALPLLKLMSEPNRLRIFSLLAGGERCVCEVEESMNLPQNLISHHLGVLREAGLIRARREGRWVYYSVNKTTLEQVYPVLCRLFNPECVSEERSTGERGTCDTTS
jgi:ArsR family transcriptional regulator